MLSPMVSRWLGTFCYILMEVVIPPQNGISLYRAYHTLHRERHLSEEGALSCEISVKRADLVLNAFFLASLCRSIAAAPPEVFSSSLLFSPHMSVLDLVYVSGPLKFC